MKAPAQLKSLELMPMSSPVPLSHVAKVIRSKNAGPFELALDIIFNDEAVYRNARSQNLFTPQRIGQLYQMPEEDVLAIRYFDAANAVKIVLERPVASGDLGDCDVYGAQQHAPLLGMRVALTDCPGPASG